MNHPFQPDIALKAFVSNSGIDLKNSKRVRLMKVKKRLTDHGFTIIELLVATALSGVVMASIYSTYYSQQKSYITQGQISAMQQNLRSALSHMEREIRMAGYDPTGQAASGIMTAGANSIRITMDITDNGGTGGPDGVADDDNEDITYALYDCDGDGDNDLGRDAGSGYEPLAENIDALNFVYLDSQGNTTSTLSQIRSVQISVLAKTGQVDPGYTDSTSYSNQQGTVIFAASNDSFRRRLLSAQVKCRNLGLVE